MRRILIEDRPALLRLKPAWDGLLAANQFKSLPLTHAWALAWWDCFGRGLKLSINCYYEADELLAILPVVKETISMRGLPVLSTRTMSNKYTPFTDVIFAHWLSDDQRGRILNHITRSHDTDVFRFDKLRADSCVHSILASSEFQKLRIGVEAALKSPFITIEGDWPSYIRQRSSSFRKSIGRRVRKAEALAGFKIERTQLQSRHDDALQQMISVSEASWKARVDESLEIDAAGREFLFRLIDEFGPQDHVNLFLASVHGRPIAYELLIGYGDTVFPIRADYDEEFAGMSPGSIVMHQALSYLFESGAYQVYDCCASDYRYLKHWTKDHFAHSDVHVFPRATKSAMIHAVKFQLLPKIRVAADLINPN